MSSFTLSNNASDIDSALTRVVSADTAPTAASQNMVTSGGVKAAIDAITGGSSGGSITTGSFTSETLVTSLDNDSTDNQIPTAESVVDFVSNTITTHTRNGQFNITASDGNLPVSNTQSMGSSIPPGIYLIGVSFQWRGRNAFTGSTESNSGRLQIKAGSVLLSSTNITFTIDGRDSFQNAGSSTSFGLSAIYVPNGGNLTATSTLSGPDYSARFLYIRNITVTTARIAFLR